MKLCSQYCLLLLVVCVRITFTEITPSFFSLFFIKWTFFSKFAHWPVCCLYRTVYTKFLTSGCPNLIVHTDLHVYCFECLDADHAADAVKQPVVTSHVDALPLSNTPYPLTVITLADPKAASTAENETMLLFFDSSVSHGNGAPTSNPMWFQLVMAIAAGRVGLTMSFLYRPFPGTWFRVLLLLLDTLWRLGWSPGGPGFNIWPRVRSGTIMTVRRDASVTASSLFVACSVYALLKALLDAVTSMKELIHPLPAHWCFPPTHVPTFPSWLGARGTVSCSDTWGCNFKAWDWMFGPGPRWSSTCSRWWTKSKWWSP